MKIFNAGLRLKKLVANRDVSALLDKTAGSVSEEDLKTILKRYNLRDSLIRLGKVSNDIFWGDDPNIMGKAAYRDPEFGVYITQAALAYIANLLLVSGSNDYKSKFLDQKHDLVVLCDVYTNYLISPELTNCYGITNMDQFCSFLVRTDSEQLKYQFDPHSLIARAICIFTDLVNKTSLKDLQLSVIFEKETGLSIDDYFKLAMAVFVGSKGTSAFRFSMFTNAEIDTLKDVLTTEKVTGFLDILKANYNTFRKEDSRLNKERNPIFTKTRFNFLEIYPIIETDAKHLGDPFIMPNTPLYIKKAFEGLYWWFHRCFENKGEQLRFREYFGYIFQEYVGLVLKGIYGEQNVHPEVSYSNNRKFFDWWVERGDKAYLFEIKANQFALVSKQIGEKELLVREEIKKIVDAIEQVYKRIQDVPKYKELSHFRSKKLIPLIVFMDMPYISSPLYESWIKDSLEKIESEKQLTGLKDFQVFRLNIKELELFDAAVGKIELEDVFSILKEDQREGFLSVIQKASGVKLRNHFLDKIYEDFWKGIVPLAKQDD